MRYFWAVGIGVCAAILLAQSAQAELIVSPESISLAGEQASLISTTLTLSDNKGIPKLTTAVSDLRRADGAALIPASSIKVEPSPISLPIDAPQSLKITIDTSKAPASGEFTGSLYLFHQNGRQVIPIVARLKAAPFWPWLVMGFGVLLGTGLSLYRAEGRSRDEIVVQIGRLRNQMRGDTELDQNFRASIDSELVDVESAVEDKDWETAKAKLFAAKSLWNNWRKGREDWLAQLAYGRKLVADHYETLPEQVKQTIYMQQVKADLEAIYRGLRTGQIKEPQMLSQAFSKIREAIFQYKEADGMIQQLKAVRRDAKLPADRENFWINELSQFENRLNNLSPNQESVQAWRFSLEEKRTEMEAEIAALEPEAAPQPAIRGRSTASNVPDAQQILSAPILSPIAQPQQVIQAERNLKWFNLIARAVSIVLLAWLGMIDLYGNKPIFGADPLRDYFALLAWGFGAEVTRESVVRATQDLGAPLTR
jgi:hypothetical protein